VSRALKETSYARFLIRSIIEEHGETLFIRKSVDQLLFKGYYSEMISQLSMLSGEEVLPDNMVGVYYGVRS